MSRLLKHPDVKAARAWYFAKVNLKIPFSEPMPQTRQGIRIKLNEAVSRFAQRGRFLYSHGATGAGSAAAAPSS